MLHCMLLFCSAEAPDYFIELMTDKKAQIAKLSSVVVTCLAVSKQYYCSCLLHICTCTCGLIVRASFRVKNTVVLEELW